jgi:hypothetical protein
MDVEATETSPPLLAAMVVLAAGLIQNPLLLPLPLAVLVIAVIAA